MLHRVDSSAGDSDVSETRHESHHRTPKLEIPAFLTMMPAEEARYVQVYKEKNFKINYLEIRAMFAAYRHSLCYSNVPTTKTWMA